MRYNIMKHNDNSMQHDVRNMVRFAVVMSAIWYCKSPSRCWTGFWARSRTITFNVSSVTAIYRIRCTKTIGKKSILCRATKEVRSNCDFFFAKCLVRISGWPSTIPSKVFTVFLSSPKHIPGCISRPLPHHSLFTGHSTLYNLTYKKIVKRNTRTARSHLMRMMGYLWSSLIQNKFWNTYMILAYSFNLWGILIIWNFTHKLSLCYFFLNSTISNSHNKRPHCIWKSICNRWTKRPLR